jgi:hypothetical protein
MKDRNASVGEELPDRHRLEALERALALKVLVKTTE